MDEHTRDPSVAPPLDNPTGWDDDLRMWEHATPRWAIEHGVRLLSAGDFHESHDCLEDKWYNYGAGTVESAFLHGVVQVVVGAYKHFDFESDVGMWSLFETVLEYLSGALSDSYSVDVDDVRTTLRAALDDPMVIHGWQIALDGHRVTAYPADCDYVEGLDH